MTDGEFDQVASWTVEAIERLGPDHAVPGACRGSGGPAAMAWLADWLAPSEATPFLDLGGGLGGPSAWLAEQHGISAIVVEPEAGGAAGGRRLFGLPVVQGDGSALPFVDATFAGAWSLGVLSTAPDQRGLLAELARVVRPGGRLGLVVYCATGSEAVTEPASNHFPTTAELDAHLAAAGLSVEGSVDLADLPDADQRWEERASAVDDEVAARHSGDDAWERARGDEDHVAGLLQDGRVEGRALRVTVADP